ncbi:hypothetical protein ACS0TY_021589 [Phlomoides rotata]
MKMKFPVRDEVGEVKGVQYQALRCYVDSMKIADKVIAQELGRVRGDDYELKKPRVIEDLDKVSKMQVEEAMMTIGFYPDRVGFTTQIGSQVEPPVAVEVIEVLRRNVDIFAFTPSDMIRIQPDVAMHHLNADPKAKPVKQKLRAFGVEKDVIVKEEVDNLLRIVVREGVLLTNNHVSFELMNLDDSNFCCEGHLLVHARTCPISCLMLKDGLRSENDLRPFFM